MSYLDRATGVAETNELDQSLQQLIQQLNGIDRPAALSLVEMARAEVQRRLVETRPKAKGK